LELQGAEASRLYVTYPGGALELMLPLPGLYNAVNGLAALAATLLMGVEPATARNTLERFSAAFGRIERINADGKPMFMALIKNPVGASETVRMLVGAPNVKQPTTDDGRPAHQAMSNRHTEDRQLHLLIAINDRHADGTDVSWLWDADFEQLRSYVARAVVSGTRANDMAVRLKYAGIEPHLVSVEPDLSKALDSSLAPLPAGETLYTLPTYTAMLELREELVRRGWVKPFWED
jgi:UDP-N-acetylmuramyl tripeptide synthase